MFFMHISFVPQPLQIETEKLAKMLRQTMLDSLLAAGKGAIEPVNISLQMEILKEQGNCNRFPVYVKIFTSDPRWVALDRERTMNRFMDHAVHAIPELAHGRIVVMIIPVETFVSP